MASDVSELTVNYEEDGKLVVKELDKVILSKGAWSTIVFRFQEWDKKKEEYSPDRFVIRRYQKKEGEYQAKGKFAISSVEQARKLVEALSSWID